MEPKKDVENNAQHVQQLVETGEYFKKARRWYEVLYHRPLGERSFFIVVTLFAFLTIVLASLVYSSLFPLNKIVPYIIKTNNLAEDVPYIRSLKAGPEEDINLSVGRFLIRNYVQLREEYNYDVTKLEQKFNRLRVTTADAEFSKYQALISPQNPASPFNKYGRNIQRKLYISRADLNLDVTPKTAKVYFTTTLIDGVNQQQEYWEANIFFSFPQLTVDQQTNKVLQWSQEQNNFALAQQVTFTVETYTTQQLGQF